MLAGRAKLKQGVEVDHGEPTPWTVYHFDVSASATEFEKTARILFKFRQSRILRWCVYKFTCGVIRGVRWGVCWFHCVGVPVRLGGCLQSLPNVQSAGTATSESQRWNGVEG
jgi:hypothetical protein